jgi:hypothetical protein
MVYFILPCVDTNLLTMMYSFTFLHQVILPLLCQAFLSSNEEAHKFFARNGNSKDTLVILVPEHLVNDARTQVFRHCLNINFKQNYRVYDDIFALLHKNVALGDGLRGPSTMKQIFVTSFNQVKSNIFSIFHSFLTANKWMYCHCVAVQKSFDL